MLPNAITLRNYRSFVEPVHFEMRPVTLLYGVNNAGKSSLLRAIPLLADSVGADLAGPLQLESSAMRGGTFADLQWKGKIREDADPKLGISFHWEQDVAPYRIDYGLEWTDGRLIVKKLALVAGAARSGDELGLGAVTEQAVVAVAIDEALDADVTALVAELAGLRRHRGRPRLAGGGRLACDRQPNPLVRFIFAVLLILLLILIMIAIIKSLGSLGPVLQPAFVSILAFIAILLGTSPAYASSGGFRKGGQADPWKCPPPPPGNCRYDVPPSPPHYPCPADHWHFQVYNQGPAPACENFISPWQLGGCGPPPVPCPPC